MIVTVALAAALVGLVGGYVAGKSGHKADAAPVVQAAADVVERTGDAVNEVPLAEARIAEALAQTPPVVAVLQMAAEKGATAEQLLAFASQESCWSHVEGEETSAGLGCLNRSAVLDALLTAPPVEPAP